MVRAVQERFSLGPSRQPFHNPNLLLRQPIQLVDDLVDERVGAGNPCRTAANSAVSSSSGDRSMAGLKTGSRPACSFCSVVLVLPPGNFL